MSGQAQAAAQAAAAYAALPLSTRADALNAVADALRSAESRIVAVADEETALGTARLTGELARTTRQLDLFAEGIRDGAFQEVIIDKGPPDLRRMLLPLGPVAVFAASNFPLAFSVAGGDTASALAAGCPVVVKAHPAHPRLSDLCAALVGPALTAAGAPPGTFGIVHGVEAGRSLVTHPAIRAVAFTGSTAGGRALADLAQSRPDPIPFYGELGSLNPVVVTEAAIAARGPEIVEGFVASFTQGSGQFCTKPGLVLLPAGHGLDEMLIKAVRKASTHRLLNERITEAFRHGISTLAQTPGVTPLTQPPSMTPLTESPGMTPLTQSPGMTPQAVTPFVTPAVPPPATDATAPSLAWTPTVPFAVSSGPHAPTAALDGREAPVLFKVAASRLEGALLEECFGPVSLLGEYGSHAELLDVLDRLPGTLTVTVHAEPSDMSLVADVLARATARAGRIVYGGWPTGVTVTAAMQHGGPWPATTNSLHTSVGFTAIRRFLRPVAFQDTPNAYLPAPLRDGSDHPDPARDSTDHPKPRHSADTPESLRDSTDHPQSLRHSAALSEPLLDGVGVPESARDGADVPESLRDGADHPESLRDSADR